MIINKKLSIDPFLYKILFFSEWLQVNLVYNTHPWFIHKSQYVSKVWPNVFFCIVAYRRGRVSSLMDQLNTEIFDLEPDLINFSYTHNV
jgi:hypothetical protein